MRDANAHRMCAQAPARWPQPRAGVKGRCEPPLTLRFSLGLRPSPDIGLGRGAEAEKEATLGVSLRGIDPRAWCEEDVPTSVDFE
jgi:hypothetical protein